MPLGFRVNQDSKNEARVSRRLGLIEIGTMSALIFLLIPWQVAFLACYIMQFNHCALHVAARPTEEGKERQKFEDGKNQKLLVLLIMTWCLPVVAPVLAVWVRTLATAGLTTPFDGDHNPLNVVPFMALTYAATSVRGPLFTRRYRCVVAAEYDELGRSSLTDNSISLFI